ncbi:MAG: hypothetical protein NVS3B28_26890 [Candidatus Velthaea sp.]
MADENWKLQRPGATIVGDPLGPLMDMVGIALLNDAFVAASVAAGTPESETIAETRPVCGGSGVNSKVACAVPTRTTMGEADVRSGITPTEKNAKATSNAPARDNNDR